MAEDHRELVSLAAQQLGDHRDEFIAELVELTLSQIRPLENDRRMVELLEASITENVIAGIHFLEMEAPAEQVEAPTAAVMYARALAQRDVPLSALIRAYRIGHGRFVDAAMHFLATQPSNGSMPAMIELVNRAATWIDRVTDQVGVAYEQERDRWVSSRSGLRQQWVNQVLAGGPIDIPHAERALQYRLNGVHVAAVMWAQAAVGAGDVVNRFDRARALLAAEFDAVGRPLMVPTDEREVRLWFARRSADAIDCARVRRGVEASGLDLRVAVGSTDHGIGGFRQSLVQAERVKAVLLGGAARSSRVVFYDEVAPVALMATDLDGLRRFVTQVLGDLAIDDERSQWLRETLREFLCRNRSYAATAEAMFLHRNTIQYRVAQAMERCGGRFDDPDAVLKVQIALYACHWLAPAVLRAAAIPHRGN
ncbi:MAG: helix-turn-helix domain-containing protein [Mycobacteriaceae bacterium]|nr:helix-turn-helix domain-containing protein [Mycobacteriaceae bacterium]MBV9641734.1 helix-turn-helix domain-containing protein [Mycobacteriaceae bacterium]